MKTELPGLSTGVSPFAHLLSLAVSVPPTAVKCLWSRIELQPDIFVSQAFTVGIAVKQENGPIHYRMLNDFRKIRSIYGARFGSEVIAELTAHTKEVFLLANTLQASLSEVEFLTNFLRLSAPFYSSGDSIDEILNRLYAEMVVVDPLYFTAPQVSRDDILVWADGSWCYRHEGHEMSHKSDDYAVLYDGMDEYFIFLEKND